MLTVFNVGQGDAFLLQPQCNCVFDAPPLLVDAGPRSGKVGSRLPPEPLMALLTHSHDDHIGGVPELVTNNHLAGLFLPYYLPEITAIFRYVRKYAKTRFAHPNWPRLSPLVRRLLKEGDELCEHIKILNPPASPLIYFTEGRIRQVR